MIMVSETVSKTFNVQGSNFNSEEWRACNTYAKRNNFFRNLNWAGKLCFYRYATSITYTVVMLPVFDMTEKEVASFYDAAKRLQMSEQLYLIKSGIQFERIEAKDIVDSVNIPERVAANCSEEAQEQFRQALAIFEAVQINNEKHYDDSSMDCD